MKLSNAFLRTQRSSQADILAHDLMLRARLVSDIAKGMYVWLPMGVLVLNKVKGIINHYMRAIGYEEVLVPVLQPAELWHKSKRYSAYGKEMLRMHDRHGQELIYGPTAEECFVDMFEKENLSYKQLPVKLYNIQYKFRDEIRPKHGVMRSREFLMKDAYSFDLTPELAEVSYRQMFDVYLQIFHTMGLHVIPAEADTGEIGGSMSHDFHVLADIGDNVIEFDKRFLKSDISLDMAQSYYSAAAREDQELPADRIRARSIEVGHIFNLGDKYTRDMNVYVSMQAENSVYPYMGCYGIGVSRLVAAIIQQHHDDKGIIWPETVAPYKYHIINLHPRCEQSTAWAERIYNLGATGINELIARPNIHGIVDNSNDIVYDDRNIGIGDKLTDADLLGMPYQIIISTKLAQQGQIEVKCRRTGNITVHKVV